MTRTGNSSGTGPSPNPNPSTSPTEGAQATSGMTRPTSDAASLHQTSKPSSSEQKRSLLDLRKTFKRKTSVLNRIESHLAFIDKCQELKIMPRGLRLNKNCDVLLKAHTSVVKDFHNIIQEAEAKLRACLINHYMSMQEKIGTELEAIAAETHEALRQASPTERKDHDDLMNKTSNNLDRQKERMNDIKIRKMETIITSQTRTQLPENRDREGSQCLNQSSTEARNTTRRNNRNSRPPYHQNPATRYQLGFNSTQIRRPPSHRRSAVPDHGSTPRHRSQFNSSVHFPPRCRWLTRPQQWYRAQYQPRYLHPVGSQPRYVSHTRPNATFAEVVRETSPRREAFVLARKKSGNQRN